MSNKNKSTTSERRQDIITKPIGPQMVRLTIPMLYALVAIMGLGIVDSYFISFLGTNELAAIGFIAPITQLVTNLGLGLGMAVSSITSKLIGAEKMHQAARVITNGLYLTACLALITIIFIASQLKNIFQLMGADQTTMPAILNYMNIWLIAIPAIMFSMVCSSTFRAIGDTKTSAKIAISMTLSNIILDPILIFGWGPIPALGIAGASIATVIAVLLSVFVAIYHLYFKERLLLLVIPKWLDLKQSISELLSIAIPAVLANSIVPITAAILTKIVAFLGTDAVAGYGVGTRIEAIMLILVFALSSTLPMFIGQNLGAQKNDRVLQAIRLSFRFSIAFQLFLYLIIALLAQPIAAQFSDQASVQETIVLYLWIVPITYGLSGVIILVNVSMNVLGKPRIALYINIIRLIALYAPLAYLGSHLYGLKGFYIAIALSHCLAYFLASVYLKRVLKQLNIINA